MQNPYLLHMPHWPRPLGEEPVGTPSDRARKLLVKLHHPERNLPPVIHVAGTKGKGSTIAFLRAMLEASCYRVHSYTTPHLKRFNERIVLAGQEISDNYLHEVIEQVRRIADFPVGFFDATTAAAMLAFAHTPADILLLEAGLGGAVDATNIISTPQLIILTTISYDHMEYMGTTLPEIAAFEAGLLKPNIPVVVSYQHETVCPILNHVAKSLNAPIYAYGQHWRIARATQGMIYSDIHGAIQLPSPSLLGAHQIVNAGNALAAISLLEAFDVSPQAIMHGLLHTQWKGRLERIFTTLLPEGSELWFDGGHNSAAAGVIALYAKEYWADKPLYLVFGSTRSKDVRGMISPFIPLTEHIYAVKVKSEPKSFSAEEIMQLASSLTFVMPADSIADAISDITEKEKRPFRALIFGSLYLWLETSFLPA